MSAFVVTFVVALSLTARAQNQGSVPQAQVAQVVETVRTSSDEKVFPSALALGIALLREGRFNEAVQLYNALAEKRPRDASVLYGAALATFNLGKPAEAEPLARRAVDAALALAKGTSIKSAENERAADALVLLGVVLAVRNDDAGALQAVKQAVRLAPDNFDAQLALGRALFGMGDDAGAVQAFRAAVALKPSDTQALFFLATTLEHSGDAEAALAAYRELVARQPRTAEGHLGLGVLLLKRVGADADEGVKELERALEINPGLYEARVTLGRVLITRGRAGEALEHLRRAAELAPGNPEPHYQLSLAYRRLGRKDEAEAESEIVKQIHERRRGTAQENAPGKP